MGCVKSVPEVPHPPAPSPSEVNKIEQAKSQRRKLSVTGEQVGDITVDAQVDDKEEVLLDEGYSDTELKGRGHLRHVALSQKGFVPYNRFKVNQDREVVKYALQNDPEISLFAVMDGHGEFGHFVAEFVKNNLPEQLEAQPNLKLQPQAAIKTAVRDMCLKLANTNINIAFSGTTLVFVVKICQKLYVANVGDSRCVVARYVNPDKPSQGVQAIGLTIDQKPDLPEERARIIRAGGRVEPLPGPPGEDCGPMRVWLAEVDVPGLAMSRSIGDEVSQTVGVISEPVIIERTIDDADLFLLLASDGIWEFLPDQEACNTVFKSIHDLKAATTALVKQATSKWKDEEEVIDDITCALVHLHPEQL